MLRLSVTKFSSAILLRCEAACLSRKPPNHVSCDGLIEQEHDLQVMRQSRIRKLVKKEPLLQTYMYRYQWKCGVKWPCT